MSDSSQASSTDWMSKPEWARFERLWQTDFEYRFDANHHPVPKCMHALDMRSGTEMTFWEDELKSMRGAPFGIGPRDAMLAYAANAELSCFLSMNWVFPQNVIDVFIENNAVINGRHDLWPPIDPKTGEPEKTERRPRLPEAMALHGLQPVMSVAEKDRMLAIILGPDCDKHRPEIHSYNRVDNVETVAVTNVIAPRMSVPHAVHRGRFIAAIAHEERRGIPVDTRALRRLSDHWERLQRHFIAQDDAYGLYVGTSFSEGRLEDLVAEKGWQWPRTPSGRLQQTAKVFAQQAPRYSDPNLRRLAHLRNVIAELRISKLLDSTGADSFARCPQLPFWTRTGRNQPSDGQKGKKVFLFALPGWTHGVAAPPPGKSIAVLDAVAQEIGIMAGSSGDVAMIADYRSGDPHWGFGLRSGLIPAGADKTDPVHQVTRQKSCKPVTLGALYGMSPYGIAGKAKRSLLWARDIHARHRLLYPTFHRWLGDTVTQAKFDGRIESPFGWPMAVIAGTKSRSLMNYPAQSGGADAMRIATIAAIEAGIELCATVHDSFVIMAPTNDIADAIETMRDIMVRAGAAVSDGLPIPASVKDVVHWPQNLGDARQAKAKGPTMWSEVWALIDGWEAGGRS